VAADLAANGGSEWHLGDSLLGGGISGISAAALGMAAST
jgi:hypothetical protein